MTVEAQARVAYADLHPGDPAPWFVQRSSVNPTYSFDTAGGRYIVLGFFGSAGAPAGAAALGALMTGRHRFDDDRIAFFGVTIDPNDEAQGRVRASMPGVRFFHDFDYKISRLYGSVPREATPGGSVSVRGFWMVIDPTLRVLAVLPLADHEGLFRLLDDLPPIESAAGFPMQAPVFVLPRVFEPELCRHLIGLYETHGGEESGFMREVDGKTVAVKDSRHKVRKDYTITDSALIGTLQRRMLRRVAPEIRKVHQFDVTRMERYIVSCYAAEDKAHFNAHRDNTTSGTAHRRFAVSINLNDDFEGGEVSFPEYGARRYKAPPGGAVVFSCSLLHAVSEVTAGRRFAFLPFLYDDAAAKIREANLHKLAG